MLCGGHIRVSLVWQSIDPSRDRRPVCHGTGVHLCTLHPVFFERLRMFCRRYIYLGTITAHGPSKQVGWPRGRCQSANTPRIMHGAADRVAGPRNLFHTSVGEGGDKLRHQRHPLRLRAGWSNTARVGGGQLVSQQMLNAGPALSLSPPPPPSFGLGEPGETHELRQELNSPNRDKKKDAVKKVRRHGTSRADVPYSTEQ